MKEILDKLEELVRKLQTAEEMRDYFEKKYNEKWAEVHKLEKELKEKEGGNDDNL